jgi:NitT/TauT family transport system substrate-binding protein
MKRVVALLLLAASCGGGTGAGGSTSPIPLRLGYFPSLTHGPAIVGVERGIFDKHLGSLAKLTTASFNAGPATIEALFSGAIDAAYIGPSPTLNAYAKSQGKAIRVIAGAASGGAFLVVKPDISAASDLKGKRLASPQLGNTQDVALRSWLKSHGLGTTLQGGGDVSIAPQENAQTLESFRSGQISGAWVPEPWATRLVQEAGAKVLVDERDLWPDGRYVTTQLIVRTEYLRRHPAAVKALLRGHLEATDFVQQPEAARSAVNDGIARVTGKPLPDALLRASWDHVSFTVDPIASSLRRNAADAQALGLLEHVELDALYDLRLLNEVLREAGRPEVRA